MKHFAWTVQGRLVATRVRPVTQLQCPQGWDPSDRGRARSGDKGRTGRSVGLLSSVLEHIMKYFAAWVIEGKARSGKVATRVGPGRT